MQADERRSKIMEFENQAQIKDAPLPQRMLFFNKTGNDWFMMRSGNPVMCYRNPAICTSNCVRFLMKKEGLNSAIHVTLTCGAVPLTIPFKNYQEVEIVNGPEVEQPEINEGDDG